MVSYNKENWLEFILQPEDYAQHALYEFPNETVKRNLESCKSVLVDNVDDLLQYAGFHLSHYTKKDVDKGYLVFLCYLTYMGHGLNLEDEVGSFKKIVKLDSYLSEFSEDDKQRAYLCGVREILQQFDYLVDDIKPMLSKLQAKPTSKKVISNLVKRCDELKRSIIDASLEEKSRVQNKRVIEFTPDIIVWGSDD
jgi:hypothetical protein